MSSKFLISGVLRPALVLLVVFLAFGSAVLGFQAFRTIQQLSVVEADRDRWQRPDDIIHMLDLKPGNTVVDFGSGSGYFALKLANTVGPKGSVLAVDLRSLSLWFLRTRAFLRWKGNIHLIVGEPTDPHLSGRSADAILVANTYHELTDPRPILRHLLQALRPGGRIVIVDRENLLLPDSVESDLRAEGIQILSRDDRFTTDSDHGTWFVISGQTTRSPISQKSGIE